MLLTVVPVKINLLKECSFQEVTAETPVGFFLFPGVRYKDMFLALHYPLTLEEIYIRYAIKLMATGRQRVLYFLLVTSWLATAQNPLGMT